MNMLINAYSNDYIKTITDSKCLVCKDCNSRVIFDDPNDIVYLYRLAEEAPLLYAKLALKKNGLQDCVDAINELN